MRIQFNPERDLVTLNLLTDVPIAESKRVDGMVFAYAADRRIVGIEILGARERIDRELLKVMDLGAAPAFPRAMQPL
ncbi:MAG TPA: DUF2283 domain-containing protein [Candidatus Methylomirabilis sp.]|nr:DUF2283 domain-containing protein [Candidatus Methylomirabilis sp.]